MFYLASETDKKKLFSNGDGSYTDASGRRYDNAIPTYNFSFRVSDCSGSLVLSCFGEIGETILGINASEFQAMHEDSQAVKDLTMNRLH